MLEPHHQNTSSHSQTTSTQHRLPTSSSSNSLSDCKTIFPNSPHSCRLQVKQLVTPSSLPENQVPPFLIRRMSALRSKFDQVKARRESLRKAQELSQEALRLSIQAKQERAEESRRSYCAQERERRRAFSHSDWQNSRDPTCLRQLNRLLARLEHMKRQVEHEKRHLVADWKKKLKTCNCARHSNASTAESVICNENEIREMLENAAIRIQNAWIYRRSNKIYRQILMELCPLFNASLKMESFEEYREKCSEFLMQHKSIPLKMRIFLSRLNWSLVDSDVFLNEQDCRNFLVVFLFVSPMDILQKEVGVNCNVDVQKDSNSNRLSKNSHSANSSNETVDKISAKNDGCNYEINQIDKNAQDDSNNSLHEQVKENARKLIKLFFYFDFSVKNCIQLFILFRTFLESFCAWQAVDKKQLIVELNNFNNELEELRNSVSGQVDYEDVWKNKIDLQQQRISQRIAQLKSNGISFSHAEREPLTFKSNISSENSSMDKTGLNSTDTTANGQYSLSQDNLTDSVPLNTRKSPLPSHSNTKGGIYPNSSIFLFGSFSKQELIHEIYMNTNFRMENFLVDKFNRQFQSSFSSFDEYLSTNKSKLYDWISEIDCVRILDVIQYIKSKLLELAPNRGSHRKEIEDFFDISHISRKITNNILDGFDMLEFALGKMKQFCAPLRDVEIDSLSSLVIREVHSVSLLCEIFVGVVQLIDKMTFDMINFLTQTVKPHVIHNVVEYEQSCLPLTWTFSKKDISTLDSIISEYINSSSSDANPIGDDFSTYADDAVEQVVKKRLSLYFSRLFLEKSSSIKTLDVLAFDSARIDSLHESIKHFAIYGAISIILKSQLGIALETSRSSFLSITNPTLSEIMQASYQLIKNQTSDENHINSIHIICQRIANQRDTLFELFLNRLIDFCHKQFFYGRFVLKNSGFETFTKEIQSLLVQFERIFKTNYQIYQKHYKAAFAKRMKE